MDDNKVRFIAWHTKGNAEESQVDFFAADIQEARTWVQNHLDMSFEWTVKELQKEKDMKKSTFEDDEEYSNAVKEVIRLLIVTAIGLSSALYVFAKH